MMRYATCDVGTPIAWTARDLRVNGKPRIKGIRVEHPQELKSAVQEILAHPGPALLDVVSARQERIMPPTNTAEEAAHFPAIPHRGGVGWANRAAHRSGEGELPALSNGTIDAAERLRPHGACPMIAHTSLAISDYKRSKSFYIEALQPLGYKNNMEYGEAAGFNDGKNTDFWITREATVVPSHVAFETNSKQRVEAFHKAAVAAGGQDNGKPGYRDYSPGYYAAFVYDPDGNNIEAVWYDPSKE